ncbi:MatE_and transmembrane domain-containing protein [Hexamita inflata]|uniref:MatE and transmembrane domain-containing protein n=1 Tax=Hexamita inflata TaxID=28002 RepID=A0AA86U9B1_9EUKA|nr:MatE and transmembrane domain-containing protein [Hexamita inflata]
MTENSSQHSTSISKSSQDPLQQYHTKIAMRPVLITLLEAIVPEALYNLTQCVVAFVIMHYLYLYVNEQAGIVSFLFCYVLINLVPIAISDSVIQTAQNQISKLLETGKLAAARIYFSYVFVFGLFVNCLFTFGILFGLKTQLAQFVMWRQFTVEEKSVFTIFVCLFALFYFLYSASRIFSIQGKSNIILNFVFLIIQVYVVANSVFYLHMREIMINFTQFIPAVVSPVVIGACIQFFKALRILKSKFKYENILYCDKASFKPFRFTILLDICKNTLYYVYVNIGDQLIPVFTAQILNYYDISPVSFTLIYIEMTNSLNKSIINNLDIIFRINLQLKRYERVYQFFLAAFIILCLNFLFQILTFSLRNYIYKQVFHGEDNSSILQYHSSIDGLIGTFNAFTMAVIRSDSRKSLGLTIGSYKLLLSVAFWFVAKYTNMGNSYFSSILYYYKYCIDLVGIGFYILFFQKFYKLKKQNIIPEDYTQVKPKLLVLQEIQTIEPISRNTSVDDSKSKEINTSKELIYSSKIDVAVSQSWTQDDAKEIMNSKNDFKK